MAESKDHWYDGRIYDVVIAPNQDVVFARIKEIIRSGATVLDVGCGTGRLEFQLEDKCARIDGVDLSQRNIEVARNKLAKRPSPGIAFHHGDVVQFLRGSASHYDYAVITYVLHEMDMGERLVVLRALAQAVREIIIVDYLTPQPRTFTGLLNVLVERAAGSEHYGNFKTFLESNGLVGLTRNVGLTRVSEIRGSPPASHIIVTRGQAPS